MKDLSVFQEPEKHRNEYDKREYRFDVDFSIGLGEDTLSYNEIAAKLQELLPEVVKQLQEANTYLEWRDKHYGVHYTVGPFDAVNKKIPALNAKWSIY